MDRIDLQLDKLLKLDSNKSAKAYFNYDRFFVEAIKSKNNVCIIEHQELESEHLDVKPTVNLSELADKVIIVKTGNTVYSNYCIVKHKNYFGIYDIRRNLFLTKQKFIDKHVLNNKFYLMCYYAYNNSSSTNLNTESNNIKKNSLYNITYKTLCNKMKSRADYIITTKLIEWKLDYKYIDEIIKNDINSEVLRNIYTEYTLGDVDKAIKNFSLELKKYHDMHNDKLIEQKRKHEEMIENFIQNFILSEVLEEAKDGHLKLLLDGIQEDVEYIKYLVGKRSIREAEHILKKALNEFFIHMYDTNKNMFMELVPNIRGSYFKNNKKITDLLQLKDRISNEPQERGTLVIYGGEVIDGGNNADNKTGIELFINNEAFNDLMTLIGIDNINTSIINKFVETQILYPKSQTKDVYTLDNRAIEAYILNRDKRRFSIISNYNKNKYSKLSVYIPCEYYMYIKNIYMYNETRIKRNYKAVLNMLIYEFLINISGKSYL